MSTTVSLESKIRVQDHWRHVSTDEVSAPVDDKSYVLEFDLEDGSGDNQIQDQFREQKTLLGNTEQAYDLAGSLIDRFGNTLTFTKIKQILVYNRNTTAGQDLKIGQISTPTSGNLMTEIFDGSNTSRLKLKAGGLFLLMAPLTGYTVTGGSADVLLICNEGAAAVTYDIVVKGIRV